MIISCFDAGANTQRYVNAADFEIQNVSVQIPIFDCSYRNIYYLPFLGVTFFPYYLLAPIQKISSVGPSISTKDDWSSVCVNQSECYMRHHALHSFPSQFYPVCMTFPWRGTAMLLWDGRTKGEKLISRRQRIEPQGEFRYQNSDSHPSLFPRLITTHYIYIS